MKGKARKLTVKTPRERPGKHGTALAALGAQDAACAVQAEPVSRWEPLAAWGGGGMPPILRGCKRKGLEAPPPGLGHTPPFKFHFSITADVQWADFIPVSFPT